MSCSPCILSDVCKNCGFCTKCGSLYMPEGFVPAQCPYPLLKLNGEEARFYSQALTAAFKEKP